MRYKHLLPILALLVLALPLALSVPYKGYYIQEYKKILTANQHDFPIKEVSGTDRAFILPQFYYSTGQANGTPSTNLIMQIDHDYADYTIALKNATAVTVTREASDKNMLITYQVLEALNNEFKVYSGTYDATNSGRAFLINTGANFNSSNSMALITGHHSNVANRASYDRFLMTAYAYNDTHIRVQRGDGTAQDVQISWVVVEWNKSRIDSFQTGTVYVNGGVHTAANRATGALATAVNTSCSLLLFQLNTTDGGMDQVSVAGYISGPNQVDFYPSSVGTSGDTAIDRTVRYYVIDFGRGCGYQSRGRQDYSANANWANFTRNFGQKLDINRTAKFVSLTHDGTGTNFPRPFPIVWMPNPGNMTVYRTYTGQEAYIEWEVLELPFERDVYPPLITLNSPAVSFFDDSWDPVNVTFNCSAVESDGYENNVSNISLFITNRRNTSFGFNRSCDIGARSGSCQWNFELPRGNYTWGCKATDQWKNFNFSLNMTMRLNYTDTIPPVFNPLPVGQDFEYGRPFYYDINATDNYQMQGFLVNDSKFLINASGMLTNNGLVPVGYYILNITIIDLWSNTNWTTMPVNVSDTTGPNLTAVHDIIHPFDRWLRVHYTAYDISGLATWNVNDTRFQINNSGYMINATALPAMIYSINITATDIYSNLAWKIVLVNVTNIPDTDPPKFNPLPTSRNISFGENISYDINATDNYGIDNFHVNDSDFSIGWQGILRNTVILSFGIHKINISVNDTSGNVNWTVIHVNVTDEYPPTIINVTNVTVPYSTSLGVQFMATDPSGISSWSVNDTRFVVNNTGFLRNNTLLAIGEHRIRIYVNDTYDNMAFKDIIVSVVDGLPPWFNPVPADMHAEYGFRFRYDANASDDVGIVAFTVNDTRFTIDANGLLTNSTGLAIGIYRLNISINDSVGNRVYAAFKVNVSDTRGPNITYAPNLALELYSDVGLSLQATDPSGVSSWTVNETALALRGNYLYNRDNLDIGLLRATVTATDSLGHETHANMVINVTPYTGIEGWSTQHGQIRMQGDRTSVPINAVRTEHSFVLLTRSGAAAYDEAEHSGIWPQFVDSTHFVLHQGTGMVNSNYVGWQVIQNPALRVIHGNQSFALGDLQIDYNLPRPVSTKNSIVVVEYAKTTETNTANFPRVVWTGELTNSTNVRLRRDTNGIAGNLGFSVVEFREGSEIQTGEIANVGTPAAPSLVNLATAVDPDESFVRFSHASSATANGVDDFGIYVLNVNPTRYSFARQVAGGVKRARWSVIWVPGADGRTGTYQGNPLTSGYFPVGGFADVNTSRTLLDITFRNSAAGTAFSSYLTEFYLYNASHFYMRREGVTNIHYVSWNVLELPASGVAWNQSSLNISRGVTGVTSWSLVNLRSKGTNTNITLECSGDCAIVQSNTTFITRADRGNISINLSCRGPAGNHTAVFWARSLQDWEGDSIQVSCEIVRDLAAPVVNINASANNTITANLTPTLGYNYTDRLSAIANCTLMIDGLIFGRNESVRNWTASSLKANRTLPDGNHSISVRCTDISNNTGESPLVFLAIDTLPPNVTDVQPAAGARSYRGRAVSITANVTDAVKVKSVYALIEWQGGQSWQQMVDIGLDQVFETSFMNTFTLGRYNVTIYANDTVDHVNITEGTWFNVTPDIYPPAVIINNTLNNTILEETKPTIGYYFVDNISATAACSLYIDDVIFKYSAGVLNNTPSALKSNDSIDNGLHEFHVNCTDNSSNEGMSKSIYLTLWVLAPNVTLVEPAPGYEIGAELPIGFSVFIEDRYGLDAILANISWQGGNTVLPMFDNESDGTYSTLFWQTTRLGRFNVSFFVNNTKGRFNNTVRTWFNVTSNNSVNITLLSPLDDTGDNDGLVEFRYSLSSRYNVSNCSLILNSNPATEDTSIDKSQVQEIGYYLSHGLYNWIIACTDMYGTTNMSLSQDLSIIPTTNFVTMNFSAVNVTEVSGLVISNIHGLVNFTEVLDLRSGPDIDAFMGIWLNLTSVDTVQMPELNASASIILYSLPFIEQPIIFRNKAICSDCSVISYSGGTLEFTVPHFTNYSAAGNARLQIWDDTDTQTKLMDERVYFFAEYTNRTSASPVAGTCNISFVDGWQLMAFNGSAYIYYRNFSVYDTIEWSVSCESGGYEPLMATDTARISRNHSNYRSGFCTAEYIQTGPDYMPGKISNGDKVRMYCAAADKIDSGEKFVVRVVPRVGLPASKGIRMPDHIERNMVVYP